MSVKGTSGPNPLTGSRGRGLELWKEIAAYLGRDVTTVRRWEKLERLPIRRLQHKRLGAVYAYTGELDAWRHERDAAPAIPVARPNPPPPTTTPAHPPINPVLPATV